MSEPSDDTAGTAADDDAPPPDGSTLLGATGVEAEVLAEAARAEAELQDPAHDPGEDAAGAEV